METLQDYLQSRLPNLLVGYRFNNQSVNFKFIEDEESLLRLEFTIGNDLIVLPFKQNSTYQISDEDESLLDYLLTALPLTLTWILKLGLVALVSIAGGGGHNELFWLDRISLNGNLASRD